MDAFRPDILFGPGTIVPGRLAAVVETAARCQVCRVHWTKTPVAGCEVCQRRAAWGIVVMVIVAQRDLARLCRLADPDIPFLAALDAVGFLMAERGRLVQRHRREQFEDQRDAQRDARSSYDQGRLDEAESRDGGW